MAFHPLGQWVLVKNLDRRDQTDGGIYAGRLLDNREVPVRKAQVVRCGGNVTKVKPGEVVAVKWSEHRVVHAAGVPCRLVHEKKILGVLE